MHFELLCEKADHVVEDFERHALASLDVEDVHGVVSSTRERVEVLKVARKRSRISSRIKSDQRRWRAVHSVVLLNTRSTINMQVKKIVLKLVDYVLENTLSDSRLKNP